MAVTFIGANGVFTQIGKVVKHWNAYEAYHDTDWPADRDEIVTAFVAGNATLENELVGDTQKFYAGLKATANAMRRNLAALVNKRLLDPSTILEQLNTPLTDNPGVLHELMRTMKESNEDVDGSVVTIGSVTAGSGNAGNGTVLTSKVLDGWNKPGRDMAAHKSYLGVDSELTVPSDTFTYRCIQHEGPGAEEGSEVFQVFGNEDRGHGVDEYGTGGPINQRVHNALSVISNGTFELWDSNVPSGWTLNTGTAGTHVVQESTAADVYRGSSSIQFTGDGSTAPEISQDISNINLTPNRRYALFARIKSDIAGGESGTIQIQCEGTGYTAASGEKLEVAPGSYSASFALVNNWINMPNPIPDDFALHVKFSTNITNAKSVWVDDLVLVPVTYFGGICFVIVAGSSQFEEDDYFTHTVANDGAGTFQEFFRRVYRVQIPSVTDGSETIADSLAE